MYCPRCSHANLPGTDQCAKCMFDLAAVDVPMPQDRVEASLMDDPVSVLAPRLPVTVPASGSVADALARMIDRGVGAVLVLADDSRLTGILTERDLLERVAGRDDFSSIPTSEVMTPNPEVITSTDSLALALRKMSVGGYRHLPVVEDGRPVGVISVRDMLRHVVRLCVTP